MKKGYIVYWVFLFAAGVSNADPVTLEDVLASQLNYFNAIRSLDYQFKEALDPPEGQNPLWGRGAHSYDQVSRVRVKGPMWRGDAGTDPESINGGYSETQAYNGELFQRVDNGDLYFRRGSQHTIPFGFVPPTLRPFGYFYNTSEKEGYSALKEEATWRNRFEACGAVMLEERQVVSEHECVVLELKPPAERAIVEDDVRWYIYLATDADLFPVRVEVKSLARNHYSSIMEVKSLERVASETGEMIWFPTVLQHQSWGRTRDNNKPPRLTVWEIDKSSLRINGEIGDEVFRIDPLSVKSALDQDFVDTPVRPRDVSVSMPDAAGDEADARPTDEVSNTVPTPGSVQSSTGTPAAPNSTRLLRVLLGLAAIATAGLAVAVMIKGRRAKPANPPKH